MYSTSYSRFSLCSANEVSRASDLTGLDEFKAALRAKKRDALFLGGGLRDGAGFEGFREEVVKTAKVSRDRIVVRMNANVEVQEITPDIKVVQVSLLNGPQSVIDSALEVERELYRESQWSFC